MGSSERGAHILLNKSHWRCVFCCLHFWCSFGETPGVEVLTSVQIYELNSSQQKLGFRNVFVHQLPWVHWGQSVEKHHIVNVRNTRKYILIYWQVVFLDQPQGLCTDSPYYVRKVPQETSKIFSYAVQPVSNSPSSKGKQVRCWWEDVNFCQLSFDSDPDVCEQLFFTMKESNDWWL